MTECCKLTKSDAGKIQSLLEADTLIAHDSTHFGDYYEYTFKSRKKFEEAQALLSLVDVSFVREAMIKRLAIHTTTRNVEILADMAKKSQQPNTDM